MKNNPQQGICATCKGVTSRVFITRCMPCMRKQVPVWNKGLIFKPKPNCLTCGAQLTNARAKRCRYTCSAVGRNKGKSPSLETRIKLSQALKGAKSHLWRGGITPLHKQIRAGVEYKIWRTAVFIRDNRTCVQCGSKKDIEADHIKPFSLYPELRFELSNGRTLCHDCHEKTESYFGNFAINKVREKILI